MVREIRQSRTDPTVEIASKRDEMEDTPNHRIHRGTRNSGLDPSLMRTWRALYSLGSKKLASVKQRGRDLVDGLEFQASF